MSGLDIVHDGLQREAAAIQAYRFQLTWTPYINHTGSKNHEWALLTSDELGTWQEAAGNIYLIFEDMVWDTYLSSHYIWRHDNATAATYTERIWDVRHLSYTTVSGIFHRPEAGGKYLKRSYAPCRLWKQLPSLEVWKKHASTKFSGVTIDICKRQPRTVHWLSDVPPWKSTCKTSSRGRRWWTKFISQTSQFRLLRNGGFSLVHGGDTIKIQSIVAQTGNWVVVYHFLVC